MLLELIKNKYMITDKTFWRIVEATGFAQHKDYNRAKEYLNKHFNSEELNALNKKSKELQAILEVKIKDVDLQLSDDYYWDLTAMVIGVGYDCFYNICSNPTVILELVPHIVENFDYSFSEIDYIDDIVSHDNQPCTANSVSDTCDIDKIKTKSELLATMLLEKKITIEEFCILNDVDITPKDAYPPYNPYVPYQTYSYPTCTTQSFGNNII